jgi:hypothetical protein
MTDATASAAATTTTNNKRALNRVDGDTAVNVGAFIKYEIASPYNGLLASSSSAAVKHNGTFSLTLFTDYCPSESSSSRLLLGDKKKYQLQFGALDLHSPVLFAHYGGVTYFGSNHMNPGAFSAGGECIQQHCTGISMQSLLAEFATPPREDDEAENAAKIRLNLHFDTLPRSSWGASFSLLPSSADSGSNTLRFRVYLSNPYKASSANTHTFQDTYHMHAMR